MFKYAWFSENPMSADELDTPKGAKVFFTAPRLTQSDRRPSAYGVSVLAIGIMVSLGVLLCVVDGISIFKQGSQKLRKAKVSPPMAMNQ